VLYLIMITIVIIVISLLLLALSPASLQRHLRLFPVTAGQLPVPPWVDVALPRGSKASPRFRT